jgi:hypothetical protein
VPRPEKVPLRLEVPPQNEVPWILEVPRRKKVPLSEEVPTKSEVPLIIEAPRARYFIEHNIS